MAVEFDRSLPRRLEALGFEGYWRLMRSMSVETAADLGARLVGPLGRLTSAHQVAERNILQAFPDWKPEQRQALLSKVWANLGRLVGEFVHLDKLSTRGPKARIDVENAARLEAIKREGRGVVFISGHFANWELMPVTIVEAGAPCRMTYREANNYWVNKRIVDQRIAAGMTMQAAKGKTGGMALLRALAKGESVALMNDQKYNEGVSAPFFGRPTMTADGATRLARRFDTVLQPMSIRRLPGSRFVATVYDPIEPSRLPDEEEAVLETVTAINGFIEARVRETPEDWFWVHRRWEKAFYRGASADNTPANAADAEGSKLSADSGST